MVAPWFAPTNRALLTLITGQSFSHIFGATTSATESLLIKRRLMGPSWLKISNVAEDNAKVRFDCRLLS
jgi:DNA polymerase alpha subunit A